MGLSRRAYARHRGCAESAVRKAIATGRITPEPDGTIDLAKADAQWAAQTDPSQQRKQAPASAETAGAKAARPEGKAVPRAAIDAVQETLRESGEGDSGGSMFLRARTANEVLKAQTARERLRKFKGELVDRARTIATVYALARRERDAWVQWPARVAALMAAELDVDPHQMETVLEKHVRRQLAELGEFKVELGRSV
jgi:hypothetical protein